MNKFQIKKYNHAQLHNNMDLLEMKIVGRSNNSNSNNNNKDINQLHIILQIVKIYVNSVRFYFQNASLAFIK